MEKNNLSVIIGNFTLCLAAVCAISACNDKNYDFSKGIDTSLSVDADLSIPLGSTKFLTIVDFLQIEENDIIKTSSSGDYFIHIDGADIPPASISVPAVTFTPSGMGVTQVGFDFSGLSIEGIPLSSFAGQNLATVASTLHINLDEIDTAFDFPLKITDPSEGEIPPVFDIDIDYELPAILDSLKEADVQSNITVTFKLDKGKVALLKDATIDFPAYFVIEPTSQSSGIITMTSTHSMKFNNDFDISSTTSTLQLKINKIDLSKVSNYGIVNAGGTRKLSLHDKIKITGTARADLKDFTQIPSSAMLTMDIQIETLNLQSAKVKLNINESFAGEEITIDGMPDFFTQDSIRLDLYNPVLRMDVTNTSIFSPEINADINAFIDSEQTAYIHIGDKAPLTDPGNKTEAIKIPLQKSSIFVSQRGGFTNADTTVKAVNIIAERLKSLFNPIPKKIEVTNITVGFNSGEWTDFTFPSSNSTYTIGLSYSLDTPLAFGGNLRFSQSLPIEGLGGLINELGAEGGKINIDLHELVLTFKMKNSIPLNVCLEAEALDADSNVIEEGIEVVSVGTVSAGTPQRPSTSPCSISLSGENLGAIDALNLKLTILGSFTTGILGMPLNTNQGIQINSMKAELRAKVNADLGGGNDNNDTDAEDSGNEDNNENS